jgi:hypothetical protein
MVVRRDVRRLGAGIQRLAGSTFLGSSEGRTT